MKLIQIFKNNLFEINCLTFQTFNMCMMGSMHLNKSISFYSEPDEAKTTNNKDVRTSCGSKRRKLDAENPECKRSVKFDLRPMSATKPSGRRSNCQIKSILKTQRVLDNTHNVSSKHNAKLFAKRVNHTKRKSASIVIVSVE